jgi:hypothetical protein
MNSEPKLSGKPAGAHRPSIDPRVALAVLALTKALSLTAIAASQPGCGARSELETSAAASGGEEATSSSGGDTDAGVDAGECGSMGMEGGSMGVDAGECGSMPNS